VRQDLERESTHQTLQRVRQALVQNEMLLHFQPKVNMRTGTVAGFEALLRWQHPQDGMIPPLSFLPKVEQSDVIVEIGEWVIEQALQQIARWKAQGHVWPVSVNIAARHFQSSTFLPQLIAILERYPDISPALLEFEILESVALGDIHAMNALIESCRGLGIQFSLDDFGTGYSSLSYLKRIAVQTLKVDQSFVRDMLEDPDDMALVESIINIAKLFRLKVVAEGVESQRQGQLLQSMGCDTVQGYGIARPMPPQNCIAWALQYTAGAQWA
jgi:EAL domain-containing protein (putative c-di-GMP-specific phosphodiesterase class I)